MNQCIENYKNSSFETGKLLQRVIKATDEKDFVQYGVNKYDGLVTVVLSKESCALQSFPEFESVKHERGFHEYKLKVLPKASIVGMNSFAKEKRL
jgi:hypothetical protein